MKYSIEMANRALPLVSRIVEDLVMRYIDWKDAVGRFEYASAKSTSSAQDPDAEKLQRETEKLAEEIEALVAELDQLSVEVLTFDTGAVAFPAEDDGQLFWTRGDAAVRYEADSASAKGTSISIPSRAQPTGENTSFASRSKSEGSRE